MILEMVHIIIISIKKPLNKSEPPAAPVSFSVLVTLKAKSAVPPEVKSLGAIKIPLLSSTVGGSAAGRVYSWRLVCPMARPSLEK